MPFGKILDLVFPPICVNCRANVERKACICAKCAKGIRLNQTLFCGKCRARIPGTLRICHRDFPYVLGAACEYDSPAIRNLVHALKFRFIEDAARPLADLLLLYIEGIGMRVEEYAVIPLPLSRKRKLRRGFNQAGLIAAPFAAHFRMRIDDGLLLRVKHAKPQSETEDALERSANIKDCFTVKDTAAVSGKNIILIDDVTTSGATFFEAAKELKAAGAGKILALSAAKA